MFAFITRVRAKPGMRDALMAANKTMQDVTAGEDGVPVYVFHTAEDAPDEFYYYDLYASQEAFEAHCQTDDFQAMGAMIGELADFIEMKKLVPFGSIKSNPITKAES